MQHSFDVDIAKEYGILEAILINNIWFWIEKNKANNKNYFDGFYWTYNSTRAFKELFPYVSERQIKSALKHLREEGILQTGNYNKIAYDRTLWYAFTDKGQSIVQKENFHCAKMSNGKNNDVQPIPYINTYNKPNGNHIIRENEEKEEKNNKTKPSKTRKIIKFIPPTLEEVSAYCIERKNNVDPKVFYDYYSVGNWIDGNGKDIKNWKQKLITWEKRQRPQTQKNQTGGNPFFDLLKEEGKM